MVIIQSFTLIDIIIGFFSVIGVFYTVMFVWNYLRQGGKK